MIDQNNKIIQELKNRPINENGSIHVARQNNYGDLIDQTKKQIYNNKKILKFECYVEWLENEVLYQTYKAQWKDNQRLHTEKRIIEKEQYINFLERELKKLMIEKKEKELNDWKRSLLRLK